MKCMMEKEFSRILLQVFVSGAFAPRSSLNAVTLHEDCSKKYVRILFLSL